MLTMKHTLEWNWSGLCHDRQDVTVAKDTSHTRSSPILQSNPWLRKQIR